MSNYNHPILIKLREEKLPMVRKIFEDDKARIFADETLTDAEKVYSVIKSERSADRYADILIKYAYDEVEKENV